MEQHENRVEEYRLLAERLRGMAAAAQFPEVRAELVCLAQSYKRLAGAPELTRIVNDYRVLEHADGASNG